MIMTGIISALWAFAGPLIERMPDVTVSTTGYLGEFRQYIAFVCYMLPMPTVRMVIGITIALYVLRMIVAFLHTIWDALPIF